MPEATPYTTPNGLTVAIPVALLLHVPPGVASDSGMVPPVLTVVRPVMPTGAALTVIVAAALLQVPLLPVTVYTV